MENEVANSSPKKSEVWGTVLALYAFFPAIAVGAVAGTIEVARGGKFLEGFDEAATKVVHAAGNFGETHGAELTSAAKTIVLGAAATVLGGSINDTIKHR